MIMDYDSPKCDIMEVCGVNVIMTSAQGYDSTDYDWSADNYVEQN